MTLNISINLSGTGDRNTMNDKAFYYECEICKGKIPASFSHPSPEGMQSIVVGRTGGRTETTFRCEKHHEIKK